MDCDILIIGSGVAGLSSAIYSARANKKVVIIEEFNVGGITATLDVIENYPGFSKINGFDLVNNMYAQVISLGVDFIFSKISNIDFINNKVITNNGTISYKALIICSGSSYTTTGIKNEYDYKFKGLSYCAICDGSLYKNRNIVVITNGNVGKSSINYLSNLTKNILVLDINDKFNDDRFKVYHNVKLNKINGSEKVESINFEVDNKNLNENCDGIFISLGKKTNIQLYKDYINCDDNFIISDENMHTNIENVFVAGDIRKKKLRQIVTACSDGAIAGTEAVEYINKKYISN